MNVNKTGFYVILLAIMALGSIEGLQAVTQAKDPTASALTPVSSMYHEGWIDFNKNSRKDVFEDPIQPLEKRVQDLLGQMTVDEKTCQLATLYGFRRVLKDPLPTPEWKNEIWKDGIANIDEMHNGVEHSVDPDNPHVATPEATAKALNQVQHWFVEQTRMGIPVEFTNEGIRGANYRKSVNFPANIALGATWDTNLISRIGDVIAQESKAVGYRNVYAPILDLARDPRWGRVVECYGEDPHLVAEVGLSMTKAIQAHGLVSTAKHFAVYSEPKGGRDGNVRTDPHVSPREMEMLHLRPWERVVKEGKLLGVMSSYNDYDGIPVSGDSAFLIDRLRGKWGFRGYVVSDSNAVEFLNNKHHVAASPDDAAAMYLREGGDVRTAFNPPETFILPVRREITAGKLSMDVIDSRVSDVLRVKFLEGLFDTPYVDVADANDQVGQTESKAVALQAARESLVLLKNEKGVLPLDKNIKMLLVCGPTADNPDTCFDRYGSSGGEVVTPLQGIRKFLKPFGTEVFYAKGCNATDKRWPESELYPEPPSKAEAASIKDAVEKGAKSDAIVVFLGDSNDTIGESKSRTSLDLPGYQNDLVRGLLATGKPLVVVLLTGKPASINFINRHVLAVLEAWFPGESGGTAIAEALFGDFNPGGKLPVTFPKSVGQIPFNFPFKPSSHASQYKEIDPNGFGNSMAEGALYPFGHGLSYTTFAYSDLLVSPPAIPIGGEVSVSCRVTNTGSREGDEVVQLYFHQQNASVTTYEMNLCGFQRVHLQAGESKEVRFTIPSSALEIISRRAKREVEPGLFHVMLASSSEDVRLRGSFSVNGEDAH
jgi:beta-glucosidase